MAVGTLGCGMTIMVLSASLAMRWLHWLGFLCRSAWLWILGIRFRWTLRTRDNREGIDIWDLTLVAVIEVVVRVSGLRSSYSLDKRRTRLIHSYRAGC